MARNTDFAICGYIYQASSSYDYGSCSYPVVFPASDFQSGSIFTLSLGPGLSGYIKEIYTTDYLGVPNSASLFKTSFGSKRYFCFDRKFHSDPFYFGVGCGNGYVLSSETTEVCDDSGTINGDGCSSTCLLEPTYKCTHWIGNAGTDKCIIACGDGIYDPGSGEQCDNGSSSTDDGCTSTCTIQAGWTCSSSIAGSPSICIGICGDGLRVSSEGCDDGIKSDGKGCKADCSGQINGWHCSGGSKSSQDVCNEQCGDGYTTASEVCDDGNTSAGDGCNSICIIENGWICTINSCK